MAVLDRYLGELESLQGRIALESLTDPAHKDAYGFGVAVGRLEGVKLAVAELNRLLGEAENEKRESGRSRFKA